jgi:hypothetical protein
MSSIPSIKAIEVNHQVANVLDAFSSVNFKINTILTQNELEKGITEPKFKRDIPENLNINSFGKSSKTPIKKNLSSRKRNKRTKSEFFKKSKQTLMLEEEYIEKKKIKKLKLSKKNKREMN